MKSCLSHKNFFVVLVCMAVLGVLGLYGSVWADEVVEEWVARYSGSANLTDYGWSIAVDERGCVYVAGNTFKAWGDCDYLTIKYDPNGTELWSAVYDGPVSGRDEAEALVLGDSGNSYVTGSSDGGGYGVCVTIKYDSDGNEVWVARYDEGLGTSNSGRDIAVDTRGCVYVTGHSGDDSGSKYLTIKYDPNGNQKWVKKYSPVSLRRDRNFACAIAVDPWGNVYVAGRSLCPTSLNYFDDYATVKYDSNGTELWVVRYGEVDNDDNAGDMCLDKSGNVYVTGDSFDRRGSYTKDIVTVKYDPNGNEIWLARYHEEYMSWEYGRQIRVDGLGNVYIGGYHTSNGNSFFGGNFLTVKYGVNGNEIWSKSYNGPGDRTDLLNGIAVDWSGSVYVTGYSYNGSDLDYATIKYDLNGNEIWVERYNGPVEGDDRAGRVVVDKLGNVYVTGGSEDNSTKLDCTTIKYAQLVPNAAPVACIIGGDRTEQVGIGCEARVILDGSCSSDVDSTPGTNDDIVYFDWYEVIDACDPNSNIFLGSGEIIECNLPLGEHDIVLEVIDKIGAFDSNEVTIIVEDTTPPEFTLSVSPDVLWPPNHKMIKITPSWEMSDNCDESPEVMLVSITMNEDDDAKGDGHTSNDIQVNDDGIWLRAERSGTRTGRIYAITYRAVDGSGNVTVQSTTVTVPHDQRKFK